MLRLVFGVQVQLAAESQGHGQHPLGDRQAVGAGGAGEEHVRAENPRLYVGVEAGGIELDPLQFLSPGQESRGHISQNDLRLRHLLPGDSLGCGADAPAAGGDGLQVLSVGFLNGHYYQDGFHGLHPSFSDLSEILELLNHLPV